MLTEGSVTPAEEFLNRYLMEDPELLAGVGADMFNQNTVRGGETRYQRPVMPGYKRLTPDMQELRMQEQLPMRPSLPAYV